MTDTETIAVPVEVFVTWLKHTSDLASAVGKLATRDGDLAAILRDVRPLVREAMERREVDHRTALDLAVTEARAKAYADGLADGRREGTAVQVVAPPRRQLLDAIAAPLVPAAKHRAGQVLILFAAAGLLVTLAGLGGADALTILRNTLVPQEAPHGP